MRGKSEAVLSEMIHTNAMRDAKHGRPGAGQGGGRALGRGDHPALKADPAVEYAEPNWIYTHQATSNDPYYTNGSLWGMYGDATTPGRTSSAARRARRGRPATPARTPSTSASSTRASSSPTPTSPPTSGPTRSTRSTASTTTATATSTTSTAGTSPATTTRSTTAPAGRPRHARRRHDRRPRGATASASPASTGTSRSSRRKFLGRSGGTTANAIKAVDYFTDLKTRHGLNIVATNNSWGGGGFSQALLDAINRGGASRTSCSSPRPATAAPTRSATTTTLASYPSSYNTTSGAGYDAVIAVAAIDQRRQARPPSPTTGRRRVDLGAPGVGIYSTLPGNTYGSYSGTSMATPHVTGAAALYAATQPGRDGGRKSRARSSAAPPTASLAGKTVTGGRLNVYDAISGVITPPPPPPKQSTRPTPTHLMPVPGRPLPLVVHHGRGPTYDSTAKTLTQSRPDGDGISERKALLVGLDGTGHVIVACKTTPIAFSGGEAHLGSA